MYLSKINIVLNLTTALGEVTLNYDPEKDYLTLTNGDFCTVVIYEDDNIHIRMKDTIPAIYWHLSTTPEMVLESVIAGREVTQYVTVVIQGDKYLGAIYEVTANKDIINQVLRRQNPHEYAKFLLEYTSKDNGEAQKNVLETALLSYFQQDDTPETPDLPSEISERFSVNASQVVFTKGEMVQLVMVNDHKHNETLFYYLDPNGDKLNCLSLTDLWSRLTKQENGNPTC